MKKTLRLTVACLAFLVVLLASVRPALADSFYYPSLSEFKGKVGVYLQEKKVNKSYPNFTIFSYDINSVKSITSSNKKVLEPINVGKLVYFRAHKTGTAKVAIKGKGKSRTVTVRVKPYTNPVKKLTIGGKSIAGKFKSKSNCDVSWDLSKMGGKKLSITPAKGWKVKKVTADMIYSSGFGPGYGVAASSFTQVKNNAKLPTKGDIYCLYILMQNKSDKGLIQLTIH